jgi:hypothetical protein
VKIFVNEGEKTVMKYFTLLELGSLKNVLLIWISSGKPSLFLGSITGTK